MNGALVFAVELSCYSAKLLLCLRKLLLQTLNQTVEQFVLLVQWCHLVLLHVDSELVLDELGTLSKAHGAQGLLDLGGMAAAVHNQAGLVVATE